MDSFFGIGAPELVLILIIAGMVMGPKRIGRTARWLGRTTTQLQNISRSFIRQLNAELDMDGENNELKGAWNDMQDLRRQIDELKGELTAVTGGAVQDANKMLADTKREVERTIAPPQFNPSAAEDSIEASAAAGEPDDIDIPPPPVKLPTRIEVADDPEE
jgi:Sec-independent protein translocase protein TatA